MSAAILNNFKSVKVDSLKELNLSYKERDACCQLAQKIINTSPVKGLPIVSSGASSASDVVSDVSYTLRQLGYLKLDSPVLNATGTPTAFNAIQGAVGAYKAYLRFRDARAKGDLSGTVESCLNMGFSIAQAGGGVGYALYRPLAIISQIKNIEFSFQATNPLGKAACWTGVVGNIMFGIFYGFLALCCGFGAVKNAVFYFCSKVRNTFKDEDLFLKAQVEQLEKGLHVQADEVLAQLMNKSGAQGIHALKKELEMQLAKEMPKWIEAVFNDLNKNDGFFSIEDSEKDTEQKIRFLIDLLDEHVSLSKSDFLKDKGINTDGIKSIADKLSGLELIGLAKKIENAGKTKEAEMLRQVGGECTQKIRQATVSKLGERLLSDDKIVKEAAISEAKGLLHSVRRALAKNFAMNSALMVAGVVGVVATILSFIFTGGVGALIVGILFLVVCFAMIAVDAYCLHVGLKDPTPGIHDKKIVIANTILATLSIVTAVALIAFFPIHPLAIAIALTVGVAWLINNSVALKRIFKREAEYKQTHITLKELIAKLEVSLVENNEDLKTLVKKLAPSVRKSLFKSLGCDMKRVFKKHEHVSIDLASGFNFGAALIERIEDKDIRADVIKGAEKHYLKNCNRELKEFLDYLHHIEDSRLVKNKFYSLSIEQQNAIKHALWKRHTTVQFTASIADILKAAKEQNSST